MHRKIAKELPAYSQSNLQRVETERKSQQARYSPLPSIERKEPHGLDRRGSTTKLPTKALDPKKE